MRSNTEPRKLEARHRCLHRVLLPPPVGRPLTRFEDRAYNQNKVKLEAMRISRLVILSTLFFCCCVAAADQSRFASCLPDGIKLGDVVSAQLISSGPTGSEVKRVTVEQTLSDLKADCRNGKLVDGHGREIRFYKLTGCWGNPPFNYQDILERQRRDIEDLKKQYTVVEMTCNPDGPLAR